MASQICTNVLLKGKEITAGFPLPYRELVLNSDGEILVRGETLCMGYFRNGLIEKVTGNDGYFHTGDIGRMLPGLPSADAEITCLFQAVKTFTRNRWRPCFLRIRT